MTRKRLLMAAMLLMALTAQAQWRVGLTAGADYNVHSMDLQYMNDFRMEGRWGATVGVTGQYDFTDWLGVRADLNWTQKNYRQYRSAWSMVDHKYRNNYLQLPVMASFSFGGEKLRGFCNLGGYVGYWMNSSRKGTDINNFSDHSYEFSEKVEFDSERDQRWDCGLVGGVGVEYRLCKHVALQAEARYYYSTTSTRKQYMRVKDYRYNSTTAIQIGASYIF
ncbi:MAG: PorT family protein [Prevotella sp.]|nr:PorT family protein [Prevotella sp.]